MEDLYESRPLRDEKEWAELAKLVGRGGTHEPLIASLNYLRHHGEATHVLIERHHIDRDHRAAFSLFYWRQFNPPSSLCDRYHFFRGPFTLKPGRPPESGGYLGYIIQRPTLGSPVGRSVLGITHSSIPGVHPSCAADFGPHINGTRVVVRGIPFCQQDSTVMTCAETSIWTAGRIMTKLFHHPLILPAQISSLATIGFSRYGRVTPSLGLDQDQMAHALTSLGMGPLFYDRTAYGSTPDKASNEANDARWTAEAAELSVSYLISSIPIIFLVPGHAVTACGVLMRERNTIPPVTTGGIRSTSEWVEGFLIQDDARGPYRIMPNNPAIYTDCEKKEKLKPLLIPGSQEALGSRKKRDWWMTLEDVDCLLVPQPDHIYLTARDADAKVRATLNPERGIFHYLRPLIEGMANYDNSGARVLFESAFEGKHGGLVYSLRCRQSVDARSDHASASRLVRQVLQNTPLPRYVWAAEFTTYDLFTQKRQTDRKLLGTLYFDATAHKHTDATALIFAHYMGVVLARPQLCYGSGELVLREVWRDTPYYRPGIPLWSDED